MRVFFHFCLWTEKKLSPYFSFAFITSVFSCTGILMYGQLLQIYEVYLHLQIHASTPTAAPFVPKIYWKSIYGECNVCSGEYKDCFSKLAAFAYCVESLLHEWVKEILSHMDHTTPNVFSNQVKYYAKLLTETCALSEVCVN